MGLCFYLIYLVEKFENLFQQPVDLVADKSHFFYLLQRGSQYWKYKTKNLMKQIKKIGSPINSDDSEEMDFKLI